MKKLGLAWAMPATKEVRRAPPGRPVRRGLGKIRPVFLRARRTSLVAVIALAAVVPIVGCAAVEHPIVTARAGAAPTYFNTDALDLSRLLPLPPANESAQTRAELDEMLAVQKSRTRA